MKRVLLFIILLSGVCMLLYSIYMVCIGKPLTEPAGIVFTSVGLLLLFLGIFSSIRQSRPKKQTVKLACVLLGHKWKDDYRSLNDPLWHKTHTCSRCGLTGEHSWERIEDQCRELCTKCGSQQSVSHSFVEKTPCNFVCEVCGRQEEKHSFVKKSDCEKVCSKCGKVEVSHKWFAIAMPKDWRDTSFWSVVMQREVQPCNLPENISGCFCERCLAINTDGLHECASSWEKYLDDFLYVTKCKHCGMVCEKLTSDEKSKRDMEKEIRRYERAVNEDEGIFK